MGRLRLWTILSLQLCLFIPGCCKKRLELDKCEVCKLISTVASGAVSTGQIETLEELGHLCEPYRQEGTWLRHVEAQAGRSLELMPEPHSKCSKLCRSVSAICDELITPLMEQNELTPSLISDSLCKDLCGAVEKDAMTEQDTGKMGGIAAIGAVLVASLLWLWKGRAGKKSPAADVHALRQQRIAALAKPGSSSPVVTEQKEESAADAMHAWYRQRDVSRHQETPVAKEYHFASHWQAFLRDSESGLGDLWDDVKEDVLTQQGTGAVETVLSPTRSVISKNTTWCVPSPSFSRSLKSISEASSDLFLQFIDKLSGEVMESIDQASDAIQEFNASPASAVSDLSQDALACRLRAQEAWTEMRVLVLLLSTMAAGGAANLDRGSTTGTTSRLALALNYVLFRLMGPKSKRFSCLSHSWDVPAVMVVSEGRAGFRLNSAFDPGTLLLSVLYAFRGLGQTFLRVAAQDQQYFRPRCFSNAVSALPTLAGSSSSMVCIAEKLEISARAVAEEEKRICTALLDYPEEFECALGMALMRDPVRLPCGQIVDRAFMIGHLRSRSTDPFTRQPLSEADLVPEPELKARIEIWISEQLKSDA